MIASAFADAFTEVCLGLLIGTLMVIGGYLAIDIIGPAWTRARRRRREHRRDRQDSRNPGPGAGTGNAANGPTGPTGPTGVPGPGFAAAVASATVAFNSFVAAAVAEGASPGVSGTYTDEEPMHAYKEARLRPFTGSDGALRWRFLGTAGKGEPYGVEAVAVCGHGNNHRVPDEACSCGFYSRPYAPVIGPGGVMLEVELYGRVIEGTQGFRAEKQRVLAATYFPPAVMCAFCNRGAATFRFPIGASLCASCAVRARRKFVEGAAPAGPPLDQLRADLPTDWHLVPPAAETTELFDEVITIVNGAGQLVGVTHVRRDVAQGQIVQLGVDPARLQGYTPDYWGIS